MMLKYIFIVFILIPIVSRANIVNTSNEHNVICGIASIKGDKVKILKKTKVIPFITSEDNPDYYFGCVITSDNKKHILEATLFTPVAKTITGNIGHIISKTNTNTKIKFSPHIFRSYGYVIINFNQGDQLGIYTLNMLIDKKTEKEMVFHVIESK